MFRDRPPERRELLCPKFKCLGRKLIGTMCPGVHSRCNQLWLGLGSLQPVPQSVGAPGKVAGAPRSGLERASVSQHTAQHLPGASTSALSSEAASEGNSSSSECLQRRRVDIYPVEVKSSVCDVSQYTPSGWHRLLIGFSVRSTLAIESVGEGALRGPGLPGLGCPQGGGQDGAGFTMHPSRWQEGGAFTSLGAHYLCICSLGPCGHLGGGGLQPGEC